MTNSILICDDDLKIRQLVKEFLEQYQYAVSCVEDGQSLLSRLTAREFDLILLDLMLPDEDGLSLCRKIRQSSSVPIIIITAVNDDIDRVAALEMGADYYMTKPLNVRVLMAYIKTILRRQKNTSQLIINTPPLSQSSTYCYTFEGWTLNVKERSLICPAMTRVTLSYGEFQILLSLAKTPRCVLSRDTLLDATLTNERDSFDRSIDVLVSRIRKKLKAHTNDFNFIKTIRNVGYLLDCDVVQTNV